MKPDLFRILACVAMVTLILVIAVKLSKQTVSQSPSPSPSPSSKVNRDSLPSTPVIQAHGVCGAGFRPDQNANCVEDF